MNLFKDGQNSDRIDSGNERRKEKCLKDLRRIITEQTSHAACIKSSANSHGIENGANYRHQ